MLEIIGDYSNAAPIEVVIFLVTALMLITACCVLAIRDMQYYKHNYYDQRTACEDCQRKIEELEEIAKNHLDLAIEINSALQDCHYLMCGAEFEDNEDDKDSDLQGGLGTS